MELLWEAAIERLFRWDFWPAWKEADTGLIRPQAQQWIRARGTNSVLVVCTFSVYQLELLASLLSSPPMCPEVSHLLYQRVTIFNLVVLNNKAVPHVNPHRRNLLNFFFFFLRYAGLSLLWPLQLRSTGSGRAGSEAMAHGPSRSAACGIFPDRGTNPCPLHRQADSQPLRHQGSLKLIKL